MTHFDPALCSRPDDKYPWLRAYIRSYRISVRTKFDPDASEATMAFFRNHYSFLKDAFVEERGSDPGKFCIRLPKRPYLVYGDTLCSFKHLFNEYLTDFCARLPEGNPYRNRRWTNAQYDRLEKEFDLLLSGTNLAEVEYASEILTLFDRLAELCDTPGNLFPCPPQFNSERSNFGSFDFPDLMLGAIYEYLAEKKDKPLYDLFAGISDQPRYPKERHTENSVVRLKDFLSVFPSWQEYVAACRFGDAAAVNSDGSFGVPIPLWTGHSFDNCRIPGFREFADALSSMIGLISSRNRSFDSDK